MPAISISTTERDEAQVECGRVYFPHRLAVLADHFAMSLCANTFGGVSVGMLTYAGEVSVETGELETAYEVNIPLDGPLRTWTGHADVCATPTRAAVYRPDGRARLHGWAGGGRLLGLKIDRPVLEQAIEELTGRTVRTVVPLGPSLDLTAGPGRLWWQLVRVLAGQIDEPAPPMVVRPLAQSLVAGLLHAVDSPVRELLAAPPARPRSSTAREAVELMEAEPESPWTAADLARRVGVSSRGLQVAFARQVGVSPMAYLRGVRLQRAHHDLLEGQGSVTAIALRWGFGHHGRFAAAYRARFGRSPSETLRLSAGGGAVRG